MLVLSCTALRTVGGVGQMISETDDISLHNLCSYTKQITIYTKIGLNKAEIQF